MKEIPHSWLIAGLLAGLIILRAFSIDTYTTAALSSLTGFLLGTHLEQAKAAAKSCENTPSKP